MKYLELSDTTKVGMEEAVSISHIEPWYDIGFYLGVKIPYLEDLKGLPLGQMNRIMRWWLGGDKDMFDYFMEPCWKTLVKAIAHPAGGNNASLAEEIALSHLAPADARFIGMQHSITVCEELLASCEKWYDLGMLLQIDRKVLNGIKSRNAPSARLKQVVVEWLKLNSSLSCLPTWSHLIKVIALLDMEKEAKALQQSHPVPRHSNSAGNTVSTALLGEHSLLDVVDTISELKDQWQALGLALKLDPSAVKEISGTTPKDCLTKVIALWLRCDKVTPSWKGLVDCLLTGLWGDNSSIVRKIIKKQPKAPPVSVALSKEQKVQAKRLYDEAMKKGYAECSTIRCLIHGSAGVGKTHVKHLLLKMPPPKVRTSTGLADNPVRAVTVSAVGVSMQDEDVWHVLDGDYDLMRTVSQMIKGYVVPLLNNDPLVVQPARHSSHPEPSRHVGVEDEIALFASFASNHTHDVMVSPHEHHMHTEDIHPPVSAQSSAPDLIQPDITSYQLSVEESFINIINQLTGNKKHLKMKWIQLLDSGGQPQFHHLLPFFIGNVSALLFVLKLSERFDQARKIECYGSDGETIGGSYETCYSHKEVMERSLKAFQSNPTDPNSSGPNDGPVGSGGPLVIVIEKKREALSILECKQAAERVQLKDDAFTAALSHFVGCNILLYYPDVLPDVVFCNPQVLISIITELVQHRYKLMEQPDLNKPIRGDWKRFKDYAYLTQKLLDEFPEHYYDSVFSSSDLIKLFTSHSIMAPVGNGEYLMPALLPELRYQSILPSVDPLPSGNILSLLSDDPTLIRYKGGGCFPNGVFCFLVAFLLNDAKWTVSTKEGKPKCLYSNSVAFSTSYFPATITIIDSLLYFAVHIVLSHGCPSPQSPVQSDIHRGILSAYKHLGIQCAEEDLIDACYCRHGDCGGEARHLADIRVTSYGSWATCCKDEARTMPLNQSCPSAVSISNFTVLEEDDLLDVKEEVIDLASRWKDLGLALRVKCSTLDTISSKNHYNPEDCLRDTLQAWLQQQYDTTKFGQPSWQVLCKAVENRAGGKNPALAKSIRERHGI
eukprot:Em0003g1430a